ncbi:MAG: PDGLE domain-containing protein [Cyanobacteriota bacterium]|nr:PDGLE domain-containing protein [Cyanobacteriota bacterium]
MNQNRSRNSVFILTGLGVAVAIATLVSPFASSDPDGLDRVALDLEFENQRKEDLHATQRPLSQIFDEYALKGVPQGLATPLAGLVGTLATFGLAWGAGKLLARGSSDGNTPPHAESPEP